MELIPLGEVELRYTSLASVDYGAGGQFYGTMEGWLHGDALRGDLRLTNLAPRRPDNVNMPTLRGLLTTEGMPCERGASRRALPTVELIHVSGSVSTTGWSSTVSRGCSASAVSACATNGAPTYFRGCSTWPAP